MSENKKLMNTRIDNLVEYSSVLISSWTQKEAGDMNSWLKLMEEIVKVIQDRYVGELKGVEKAELATDVVVQIAKNVYEKHMANLDVEEQKKLKENELKVLVLIIENPIILNASTSIFKKLLRTIDKNKDGEITMDECKQFWCCHKS